MTKKYGWTTWKTLMINSVVKSLKLPPSCGHWIRPNTIIIGELQVKATGFPCADLNCPNGRVYTVVRQVENMLKRLYQIDEQGWQIVKSKPVYGFKMPDGKYVTSGKNKWAEFPLSVILNIYKYRSIKKNRRKRYFKEFGIRRVSYAFPPIVAHPANSHPILSESYSKKGTKRSSKLAALGRSVLPVFNRDVWDYICHYADRDAPRGFYNVNIYETEPAVELVSVMDWIIDRTIGPEKARWERRRESFMKEIEEMGGTVE